MAVLLNVTTTPQSFAAGTFNTAATAMNSGVSRFTFTPTAASTTYTGGNFHILFGQVHGGLWLNDTSLELYDTPNDNLVFAQSLTWTAGQPVSVKIDARSGSRAVTISGAATGNGTFSFSTAGPYYDPTDVLDSGRFTGGGASFDFVGTISSVDDTVSTDTVTAAAIAIVGGTVQAKVGRKDAVAAAAITLVGGSISEGQSGQSDGVSPASIALVGGTIATKRTYAVAPIPASIALVGGSVGETRGGQITPGPTAIDFQRFSFANRASSVTVNTPASGAVVLLCAGGKNSDISVAWTDSDNVTSPVVVGALVSYPDFTGYGTIVALTPAPMAGGVGQTFTQPVTSGDENTTFALAATVVGGHPRVTEVHNNVANASGTTQQTSPSITIDGEALLVAFWWGASPVVPPFSTPSPGIGTPYTAVPDSGFVVVQSYLVNNEFGEVQAAMATLYVPAGAGSSTRSVTWTHSPAQGAQLRLVAIQPALSEPVTSASIALVGQSVGERIAYREAVSPASLQISGGAIVEGVQRMDAVTPAAVTLVGGSVLDRRALVDSVSPALLAIVGGVVLDQVSNNQQDLVTPALIALAGASVGDRVRYVDAVAPASIGIAGAIVQDRRAVADAVGPATVGVAGGVVQDRRGVAAAVLPASIEVAGGVVQDKRVVIDAVVPASMTINGGVVQTRLAIIDSVAPAAIQIHGGNVSELVPSNGQDIVSPALVALVGGVVSVAIAHRVSVQPAAISLSGGQVLARAARKDVAGPAAIALLGGVVLDQVTSGARDGVSPAVLSIVGAAIQTRVTYVVPVAPALVLLRGAEVQDRVSSGASVVPPPIPPGRAAGRLEGRVVVPSIESRESEQAHLFGVIRSKNDV